MSVFLETIYTGIATVCVMIVLQVILFMGIKIAYPPAPKVIYRDVPVYQPQVTTPPVLTQPPPQEVTLPPYESRVPSSNSTRLDVQLPDGLQETRPPGI
jgi:hypothetical protein